MEIVCFESLKTLELVKRKFNRILSLERLVLFLVKLCWVKFYILFSGCSILRHSNSDWSKFRPLNPRKIVFYSAKFLWVKFYGFFSGRSSLRHQKHWDTNNIGSCNWYIVSWDHSPHCARMSRWTYRFFPLSIRSWLFSVTCRVAL